MKKYGLVLVVMGLYALNPAQAQSNCGCHFLITRSGSYSAKQLNNVQPGQTICVQAGAYSQLRFTDLQGAPGAPIRIINCGGLVSATNNVYYAVMQFLNCNHFVVSGSGDASVPYGFSLSNSGTSAGSVLNVAGKSSNCEIERVEVSNNNFAGIMVKTDPGCDTSFYRGNFTMQNVKIHDTYVHDTGGEGMYIGNSSWNTGVNVNCGGQTKRVYPHEIHGLEIHHNRVERTGCEGIQIGCAPGALVHHNTIRDAGLNPFASYQNSGLQIGGGASGECYNNLIINAPGNGIPIIGFNGNLKVYNNVVANIGSIGIFADDREGSQPGAFLALLNNTIVNCGDDGIRLYSNINANTVANNVLAAVEVPKYITFGQGATATQFNNVKTTRTDTLGFVDVPAGDFHLKAGSALVDAGGDVSAWGVGVDLDDAPRPAGVATDVGAFERQPSQALRRAAEPVVAATPPVASKPGLLLPDEVDEQTISTTAYPSPCQDHLTLQLSAEGWIEQVVIYQTNGQPVLKLTPQAALQRMKLNTRNLKSGSYLYQIKTDRETFTGKFLKQ